MFGGVPDPTVMTIWVGFRTVSDTHARGRLELVGCAEGFELREKKRERPGTVFGDRKRPTKRPATIAAIFIRWGIKRTLIAIKLDRRSIYTTIRPHANSHPIPRTFSGHL